MSAIRGAGAGSCRVRSMTSGFRGARDAAKAWLFAVGGRSLRVAGVLLILELADVHIGRVLHTQHQRLARTAL